MLSGSTLEASKESSGSVVCDAFLNLLDQCHKAAGGMEGKIFRLFPMKAPSQGQAKDEKPATPFVAVTASLQDLFERLSSLNDTIQREL